MPTSRIRTARDYNRSLAWPVRMAHLASAAILTVVSPVLAWPTARGRRHWAVPAILISLAGLVLAPFDSDLVRWAHSLRPGGDLRRELHAWQQYGAIGSLVFVAGAMALLEPRRVRRCLDLFLAAGFTSLACLALKMLVGRPRPSLGNPEAFLGPLGVYPIEGSDGKPVLMHAWEVWGPNAGLLKSQLWSFPSSHTGAAMALSVFLIVTYPRLRPLAVFMVALVALSRVLLGETGAHWPSDVVAGAALGFLVSYPVVTRSWGVRLLDRLWLVLVDRSAMPALPALEAYERYRARSRGSITAPASVFVSAATER
ncbi:MAG: phosphatase PAP2 family protein [Phycisphaerales bacterium]|nr:phosphatase PAP2 family protein [Phycisphaerales bacterium]